MDDVAPEVISFRYDNEKNTIEIEFSEPVLGADKANAYRLKRNEKTQEIKGVVVKEKRCYQLVLPDDLPQATIPWKCMASVMIDGKKSIERKQP